MKVSETSKYLPSELTIQRNELLIQLQTCYGSFAISRRERIGRLILILFKTEVILWQIVMIYPPSTSSGQCQKLIVTRTMSIPHISDPTRDISGEQDEANSIGSQQSYILEFTGSIWNATQETKLASMVPSARRYSRIWKPD